MRHHASMNVWRLEGMSAWMYACMHLCVHLCSICSAMQCYDYVMLLCYVNDVTYSCNILQTWTKTSLLQLPAIHRPRHWSSSENSRSVSRSDRNPKSVGQPGKVLRWTQQLRLLDAGFWNEIEWAYSFNFSIRTNPWNGTKTRHGNTQQPHDKAQRMGDFGNFTLGSVAHLGDSKSHGDLKRTSGPAALFKMIHAMPQLHCSWCISSGVESNHTKAAKGHGRGPIGQHDLDVHAEPFSSVVLTWSPQDFQRSQGPRLNIPQLQTLDPTRVDPFISSRTHERCWFRQSWNQTLHCSSLLAVAWPAGDSAASSQ